MRRSSHSSVMAFDGKRNGHVSRHAVLNLFQDCMLSVAASVLTVILLRWLSGPVQNFTLTLLIFAACVAVFTLIGSLLSGSHRAVKRFATVNSVSSRLGTILVKETLLVVLLALFGSRIHADKAAAVVVIAVADSAFTAFALFFPIVMHRSIVKNHSHDIRKEASTSNALVAGSDQDAMIFAQQVAARGEYNILGLLSDNPEDSGMVMGDYVVFYAKDVTDISNISWKLGGVDCVLFPKSLDVSGGYDNNVNDVSHKDSMSLPGRVLKRSFDFILSLLLVIVFLPLGLMCALAIRLEDGGPVFYRQERIGLGGRSFHILKFRSMRTDAEASGPCLYSGEADPRLTLAGAFLRSHHLDELPQLLNVLAGDMSFVGYRPERPCYIESISDRNPRYCFLYQIRPGVTSYATLYNGYTDTLEKMLTRLDLDLYYLRHHSVWFDLKVLWLTFVSIVSGKKF